MYNLNFIGQIKKLKKKTKCGIYVTSGEPDSIVKITAMDEKNANLAKREINREINKCVTNYIIIYLKNSRKLFV